MKSSGSTSRSSASSSKETMECTLSGSGVFYVCVVWLLLLFSLVSRFHIVRVDSRTILLIFYITVK